MDGILQDVRVAFRRIRRQPVFALAAVVTLGLGIGLTTAIFSVVDVLMFRPLPVPGADRLVSIVLSREQSFIGTFSYPQFHDYSRLDDVFDGVAASSVYDASVAIGETRDREAALVVSGDYFPVLGLSAERGRLFDGTDHSRSGYEVVISHAYWRDRLAGDPAVVGRVIRINGSPFTIVGVTPESFRGTQAVAPTNLYVPDSSLEGLGHGYSKVLDERTAFGLRLIARLREGVTMERANAAVAALSANLAKSYPQTEGKARAIVYPEPITRLEPAAADYLPWVATIFMTLVGLVLALACSNVASLMLARAITRQKEMAIRAAIGAGRLRVVRQLIVESLTVATLGGALGWGIAIAGTRLLSSVSLEGDHPIHFDFSPDATVLTFAIAATALAGLATGLLPALRATAGSLATRLAEESRGGIGSRRQWVRSTLVTGQIAISVLLLVVTGLFVRSLRNSSRVDLGFDPHHRLVLAIDLHSAGYERAEGIEFYRTLVDRARALPGVQAATSADYLPIDVESGASYIYPDVRAGGKSDGELSFLNVVDTDYFETMGIPILDGRAFTKEDDADTPGVVIVNETFARRYWPGQNPIGRTIRVDDTNSEPLEVVGVARDGKYNLPGESPQLFFYEPIRQHYRSSRYLILWTKGDPMAEVSSIREIVRTLDPSIAIFNVKSMERHLAHGKGALLLGVGSGLVGSFSAIGVVLAIVGLWGLTAFTVGQRKREFGIRMSLGATGTDILFMVVRRTLTLAGIGMAIGSVAALGFASKARSLFVGVSASDPLTWGVVLGALLVVALAASIVPATGAARTSPMSALSDR